MQNMLKFGLKTLFLLVVLLGVGAIYSIDQSQTYGRLINYVGIVRGATQRLVKLELAQEPHDDLIAYLDGIQDELRTGEGPYGLIRPDDLEYNNNLSQLQRLWGTLKEDILAARTRPRPPPCCAPAKTILTWRTRRSLPRSPSPTKKPPCSCA